LANTLGVKLECVIAGSALDGVEQQVVDACDGALEIPQFGTKHSLNVAVSTALAIYQLTLLR
ncbi:MAG: hypothetical protein K2G64_00675, partial [Muribaculaceae bacterium]|nr:hypothetical protein [Muribaculaceae bacterium]